MSLPDRKLRPLTEAEKAIVDKLLSHDFNGRTELLQQLVGIRGEIIDDMGSLRLEVLSGEPAPIRSSLAVEARFVDLDTGNAFGPCVNILLHVKEGRLSMLGIYKDDSSKLLKPIVAENLEVFSQYSV